MYILTNKGVMEMKNGVWSKVTYSLTVNGVQYLVAGETKRGNLKLVQAAELLKPELTPEPTTLERLARSVAKTATVQPVHNYRSVEQVTDRLRPAQHELFPTITLDPWPALKQKLKSYMKVRRDGRETTPQERNVLAERLAGFLDVSDSCAWAWIRDDGPKPQPRNLRMLAKFNFDANRL